MLVVLFLFSNVVEYYSDVYNESEQELLITVLDLEVYGESKNQISSYIDFNPVLNLHFLFTSTELTNC